jgi:hypothetical protein
MNLKNGSRIFNFKSPKPQIAFKNILKYNLMTMGKKKSVI